MSSLELQDAASSQKGGALVIVVVLAIVGFGLIGGLFLVSQNTSWFSSADTASIDESPFVSGPAAKTSALPSPRQTPRPSENTIEQVYQNPFDEDSDYQNPFEEEYENPFNSL